MMTFEEWWNKRFSIVSEYSFERPEIAVLAFHDATQAERERCAKIAEHIGQHHDFYDGPSDAAKKIAKAIREKAD